MHHHACCRFLCVLQAFSGTDLVIEAVTEQEPLKRALFGELDRLTQPACILASNTSSISITRLSAATRRPEKVVGLHFMNPPPLMKLIEVVKGKRTSEEVTFPPIDVTYYRIVELRNVIRVVKHLPAAHWSEISLLIIPPATSFQRQIVGSTKQSATNCRWAVLLADLRGRYISGSAPGADGMRVCRPAWVHRQPPADADDQ